MKLLINIFCVIFFLTVIVFSVYSQNAEYTVRYGLVEPDTDPVGITANEFARILSEKSNGRIEIKVFPNGQLGNAIEIMEGLMLGNTQMGNLFTGVLSNNIIEFSILDLPFAMKDYTNAYRILDGELKEKLGELTLQRGLRLLGFLDWGFRMMYSNRSPIKTLEDLKGIKIRTPESSLFIKTYRLFGANPTPIPAAELYTALQTGVVDAYDNSLGSAAAFKWGEVTKYASLTSHMFSCGALLINEKFFQKLPNDLQEIVVASAEEAIKAHRGRVAEISKLSLEELKKQGVKEFNVPDMTPFKEAVSPLWDEWRNKSKEIAELMKLLD